MAWMMGGAQENLSGGETDQQTLFMIQGVMGAMGGGGTAPPWLGSVSSHALIGPGKYVYMSLHPKTGEYCHRHGEVGAMHCVCS